MLSLVSGHYPSGPGQVALTSQVASVYGVGVGGVWHADGRAWRVTGMVQNPANLLDEFALVAPGQVTSPTQVTILLGPAAVPQDQGQDQARDQASPRACRACPRPRPSRTPPPPQPGSRPRRSCWWWPCSG